MFNLAVLFQANELLDNDKIFDLYQKSAELGNIEANFVMGKIYDFNKDHEKAYHYFKLCSESNHSESFYFLGLFFFYSFI
jgi:TPR repeat protein